MGLKASKLSYNVFQVIRKWHKGEISGKRCAKEVVDALAAFGGAVAGGAAGAACYAFLGPVGAAVGGVVGVALGSLTAAAISEEVTLKIFDLPRDRVVDNAYFYFGLTHRASNAEINKKRKQKQLEVHPDRKGGSTAASQECEIQYAIIKNDREKY